MKVSEPSTKCEGDALLSCMRNANKVGMELTMKVEETGRPAGEGTQLSFMSSASDGADGAELAAADQAFATESACGTAAESDGVPAQHNVKVRQEILKRIAEMDLTHLTPMEAFFELNEMQTKLNKG